MINIKVNTRPINLLLDNISGEFTETLTRHFLSQHIFTLEWPVQVVQSLPPTAGHKMSKTPLDVTLKIVTKTDIIFSLKNV